MNLEDNRLTPMRRFRRNRVPRRPEFWPRAWRRHPLAFVILLAVAGVLSYQRVKTPFGTDHERYHNRTFTCIHVVDGDTFDIDAVDGMRASTRVRLWGVDTPETVKPGTAPMHFGPEASVYAKSRLLGQRVRIVLAPDRTRDRYDRLLAYVYPPDSQSTLNEDLIEQGFAYADPRFPHPWRERFLQLEERARKAKAGLWAAVRPEQMPEWRQRMEGRRKDAATR